MRLDIYNIDRRIIYLLVFIAISIPIIFEYSVRPTKLDAATRLYNVVEGLETDSNKIAFIAFDFGPNTKAELQPQAEVLLEHLFRRRVPVAIMSLYALAEGFLDSIPKQVAEKLMEEYPGERWEYGKDWINLGYRPGMALFIQAIAKSKDIVGDLAKDAMGNTISEFSTFAEVKTLEDIQFLGQITGLVGVFNTYVQFFQKEGYVPVFGHGCTSITIPEAYIYLDSGQIRGLFEGLAGAAWYSELLNQAYPKRKPDAALIANTALGVAQVLIIILIIFGNVFAFIGWRKNK